MMWSGIEPDALRRAGNAVALSMRIPVEERIAIIGALYDQATENEEMSAMLSELEAQVRGEER